jgi:hypothetical protein
MRMRSGRLGGEDGILWARAGVRLDKKKREFAGGEGYVIFLEEIFGGDFF